MTGLGLSARTHRLTCVVICDQGPSQASLIAAMEGLEKYRAKTLGFSNRVFEANSKSGHWRRVRRNGHRQSLFGVLPR